MLLRLILRTLFILPFVYSGNVTLPNKETKSNNTTKVSNDKMNLTLPSEGGTLLANTPDITLPNKQTTLLTLDEELEKTKQTSIKARKGVDGFIDEKNIVQKGTSTESQSSTVTLLSDNAVKEAHEPKLPKILSNVTAKNKTLAMSKQIPTTIQPKKPLILSYEALASAGKNIHNDDIKITAMNPSPKTLPSSAQSQIPSPNGDATVKVYPSKVNSHPGMIMPIVITILVVPMFAIFGYLAVKRGQEAWKNRHYKRMDFLLDGMYND